MRSTLALIFVLAALAHAQVVPPAVHPRPQLRGNDTLVDGNVVHIVPERHVRKVMDATLQAPNPLASSGSPHHYYLIVGTFAVPGNATRLKAQLLRDGRQASLQRCLIDGKPMYAVFVGHFGSFDDAHRQLEEINKAYGLRPLARTLALR